ncbi:MAG TPA: tyrosine-type recombinase/integrase [Gaiellaceae bacterium]|nr:tyrosine-type recombinase/integrase [Gaiellaceae bacterium]
MAGYIRKRGTRKDGSTKWQARYWDANDPTKRYEKVFRRKEEAERWLVQQSHAQLTGTHIDPRSADRPFRDVIDAWKDQWVGLEPKTRAGYEGIIEKRLLPEFGSRKVSTITTALVQKYVNRLKDEELSPATVRNVYACMRAALNSAVTQRVILANPCLGVKLPRMRRQEMLFLTAEEVRALADAITPYYRALILTAAYTGLRSGELLALRRADVDLLRGVVHVSRALKEVNGHLHFGPTKTHAHRTVSLPRFLRNELETHLSQPLPGGNGREALIFPGPQGGPLRHGNFYRRHFQPAVRGYTADDGTKVPGALPAEKAGLRFHDLRHTCAALSIAAGAHPKMIQARLGHSSIQITLDRYGHLFPSVEEALADALDAAFAPEEPELNVTAIR